MTALNLIQESPRRLSSLKTRHKYYMSPTALLQRAVFDSGDDPRQIVARLVQSNFVQTLLANVGANHHLIEEIAKKSYWHNTGIFKLVLWKPEGNLPEVRIHIWSDRSRNFSATHVDSIHNHRWNFASNILVGSFLKEIFETTEEEPKDHQHFQFESQGRGQPNKVTQIGNVKLRTIFTGVISSGNSYYLDSRMLHRITPIANTVSATLFAASSNLFAYSDVLFSPESRRMNSEAPPAPKLTPEMIIDLLSDLGNTIDQPQ